MTTDPVGTVRREDHEGGHSLWLRVCTAARGEHWACSYSTASGNPGMAWVGWGPIEDHTVIIGAVPGTPAADELDGGAR